MPFMYSSEFPLCQMCGKPRLSRGLIVLSYGPLRESQYCAGHDEPVRCPHCGAMVNAHLHPFKACEYFQGLHPLPRLREDEVLAEVEAILKRGRDDE